VLRVRLLMVDTPEMLIWLSIASGAISYTITKTPVFEWLRDFFNPDTLIGYLMQCPYCMGHWVSFFLIGVYQPMPFTGTYLDFLACAFAVAMLQTFVVQTMIILGRLITLVGNLGGE
jgi:hypothetical protein